MKNDFNKDIGTWKKAEFQSAEMELGPQTCDNLSHATVSESYLDNPEEKS